MTPPLWQRILERLVTMSDLAQLAVLFAVASLLIATLAIGIYMGSG